VFIAQMMARLATYGRDHERRLSVDACAEVTYGWVAGGGVRDSVFDWTVLDE
jgi:hypothetical protein